MTRALRRCLTALCCSAAPVFAQQVPHPAWSRNAVIYEVNIRQYTPEGTLAAFERHLPRLDSLHVDILWIMPVQPIGQLNRKGPLGSYTGERDYLVALYGADRRPELVMEDTAAACAAEPHVPFPELEGGYVRLQAQSKKSKADGSRPDGK